MLLIPVLDFKRLFFEVWMKTQNSVGRGHLAKLPVCDPAHKKVLIMVFANSEEEETRAWEVPSGAV